MELRLLRCFEAVARLGSLSAASAELHITQPALSRQLRELERSTGFELFDRGGYRLTLTRTGNDFLPHTRKVLLAAAQLDEIVRTQGARPESQIVIACPSETARHIIAPLIARGQVATSRLVTAPADEVLRLLARGECDVAIGTGAPPAELIHEVLGTIPVVAQHARSEVATDQVSLDIAALHGASLVVVDHYRGVRQALDEACSAEGVVPATVRAFSLPEVAQAYTSQHGGLCIMSGEPTMFGLAASPVCWRGRVLRVPLRAAWTRGSVLDAQIRRVIAQIGCSESLGEPGSEWPVQGAARM